MAIKSAIPVTITLLTMVGGGVPAWAQNTDLVNQLLSTNQCRGCDLNGTNLNGANLSNADLTGANLSTGDLSGATLYVTTLKGTNLTGANLSNANLTGANLSDADLTDANLTGAGLSYANLTGAILLNAALEQANLGDTNLSGANLSNVKLNGANMSHADLTGSDLSSADLSGASLTVANFATTNLTGANLSGANLQGAQQLETANLTDANLANANLQDTALSSTTIGDTGKADNDQEKQFTPTPLQGPPVRLFNLETANQLPGGSIVFTPGTRIFFETEFAGGSGSQVNTGSADGGVTDRLQLSISGNLYDDPLTSAFLGQEVDLVLVGGAASIKYQIAKSDDFAVSALGSLEVLRLTRDGALFLPSPTSSTSTNILGGALQFPISYTFNSRFQIHLTPGVTFFPDTIDGAPFYGTIGSVGGGVSWQALDRLHLFGDITGAFFGDNAVRSSDGTLFKRIVWSAGFRYLVNPAVGVDIYATNALGYTPGTHVLAFVPDGEQTGLAFNLNFTPDIGQNYPPSFRKSRQALTSRDTQLLLDGITLATADTLLPRSLRLRGGTGAGTQVNVATALTHDVQLELFGEDFSENADLLSLGDGLKLGAAAKIRLLDQVQGDPLSIAIKGAFSQDVDEINGTSFAALILQYRPIPRLALTLNPMIGLPGSDTVLVGTGFGANLQLWKGFQLIGEVTPVLSGADRTVWSAGLRYFDPKLKLGVDVYGSNAIGQNSFSPLSDQPDPTIGVNVHWLFGGN